MHYAVEKEGLAGLAAARALSALQDAIIQVIYDFAVKHVYYAQNPSSAERIAVVATGGYGRGELAPGSDIDLLFLRPFKQTAWGESVIEFILYMLWDLGLKVGHATRSLAESVRLAKQDVTIRTAILETRYLWGDQGAVRRAAQEILERGRHRQWPRLCRGQAGRTRACAMSARAKAAIWSSPTSRKARAGLRDLQTLYWIGKYLYHVEDTADLVDHGVFTRDEYRTFQKAEAFLWNVRVRLHYLLGRAEERLSFDVQPALAAELGYVDAEKPRRAVEAFMRAYFLVAKDVGDLTRIFCAALEEQHQQAAPVADPHIAGLPASPRSPEDDFYVENGRLNANPAIFRQDPANILRLFHIADIKGVDIHPDALRTVTRSLDLITDEVRNNPEANHAFLEALTSRHDPERALRLMNEAGVLGRFIPEFGHAVGLMQFNMYHHYTVDEHLIRAVGHVAEIERGDPQGRPSPLQRHRQAHPVARCALLRHPAARHGQGPARRSQRCGRGHRHQPVPAAGPFRQRHRGRSPGWSRTIW